MATSSPTRPVSGARQSSIEAAWISLMCQWTPFAGGTEIFDWIYVATPGRTRSGGMALVSPDGSCIKGGVPGGESQSEPAGSRQTDLQACQPKRKTARNSDGSVTGRFDAIVVGGRLRRALHALPAAPGRFECLRHRSGHPMSAAPWYWNRYPGCRCDIESFQYSYQFDKDLQQEWTLGRNDMPRSPRFWPISSMSPIASTCAATSGSDTRVTAATFDETANDWEVANGFRRDAARPLLHTRHRLPFQYRDARYPGHADLQGRALSHRAMAHRRRRFHRPPDRRDRHGLVRRAVDFRCSPSRPTMSMSSSGHPISFVEAQNRPLPPEEMDAIKADYDGLRENAKSVFSAYVFPRHDDTTFSVSPEEREARFEEHWNLGGLQFFGAFSDMLTSEEANAAIVKFWRAKIGEVVKGPRGGRPPDTRRGVRLQAPLRRDQLLRGSTTATTSRLSMSARPVSRRSPKPGCAPKAKTTPSTISSAPPVSMP